MGQQIPRARPRLARYDRDRGARRVVAVLHSRSARLFAVRHLLCDRPVHAHCAEHLAQAFQRQPARAKKLRRRDGQIDNGRFHAHLARAAIHDAVDLAPHVLAHSLGVRTGRTARGIGARRGDRHAGTFDDGARDRVVGTAHADGLKSSGRPQRDKRLFLQDHRQRTRPKPLRQQIRRFRHILTIALQPAGTRNMQNERIVLRSSLGFKNTPHSLLVETVRTEPVHGLGRNGKQSPASEDAGGLADLLFLVNGFNLEPLCVHFVHFLSLFPAVSSL